MALRLALDFLCTDQMGRTSDNTPINITRQQREPVSFTSHFSHWEPHFWDETFLSFEAVERNVVGRRPSVDISTPDGGITPSASTEGISVFASPMSPASALETQVELSETPTASDVETRASPSPAVKPNLAGSKAKEPHQSVSKSQQKGADTDASKPDGATKTPSKGDKPKVSQQGSVAKVQRPRSASKKATKSASSTPTPKVTATAQPHPESTSRPSSAKKQQHSKVEVTAKEAALFAAASTVSEVLLSAVLDTDTDNAKEESKGKEEVDFGGEMTAQLSKKKNNRTPPTPAQSKPEKAAARKQPLSQTERKAQSGKATDQVPVQETPAKSNTVSEKEQARQPSTPAVKAQAKKATAAKSTPAKSTPAPTTPAQIKQEEEKVAPRKATSSKPAPSPTPQATAEPDANDDLTTVPLQPASPTETFPMPDLDTLDDLALSPLRQTPTERSIRPSSSSLGDLDSIIECLTTSSIDLLQESSDNAPFEKMETLQDADLANMMQDLDSVLRSTVLTRHESMGAEARPRMRRRSSEGLADGEEERLKEVKIRRAASSAATSHPRKRKERLAKEGKSIKVSIHRDDGKAFNLSITDKTTAQHVVFKMVEKTRTKLVMTLCIVERISKLNLERRLEDHETIEKVVANWPLDHENRLIFRNAPSKYALWERPQLPHSVLLGICEGGVVPDVEGVLSEKPSRKKSWRSRYFALQKFGVNASMDEDGDLKAKTSNVQCIAMFADHHIYTPYGDSKANQGPTRFTFFLKPHSSDLREDVKCLCAENGESFVQWIAAIRMMKFGAQLKTNYTSVQKQFVALAKMKQQLSRQGVSAVKPARH